MSISGKYYILCSYAIGGAEKRFTDIFKYQVDEGRDVTLVLPSILVNCLFTEKDLNHYKRKIEIINIKNWNFFLYSIKYAQWLLLKSDKNKRFHYPLNPLFFLHFIPKTSFSISLCDCTRAPGTPILSKLGILERFSIIFSKNIDVLSPTIFRNLKALKSKVNLKLTPNGSFIKIDHFNTTPKKNKKHINVVFFARLEKQKGILTYLELVTHYLADKSNKPLINFSIYGHGSLLNKVLDSVQLLKKAGANIEYHGIGNSDYVFPESDILLSLQENTNYPSRSVIEALIYGCKTLITNTGDSQSFGNKLGIFYTENDPHKIYQSLIFALNDKKNRNEIIESILATFDNKSYSEYMYNI